MGAVVATVDAVNAESTLATHPVSVRQVALADSILLTKLDLIDPAERPAHKAALLARLAQINSAAQVLESDDSAADPVQVMRQAMADPREDPRVAKAW